MLTAREISQGLFGAWQLAHFNDDGILCFDNTPEAAIASFKAALLAAPIHVVLILLQTDWEQVTAGAFGAFLIHVITFVADWTAFPLAMFYIARLTGRDQWFHRWLGAYNWAQVLQIALFFAISLVVAGGVLPPAIGGFLLFGALIAIFVYKGFIARVGLEATTGATVGIVLLDLGVSALLSAVMASLLRGQGLLGG